MASLGADELAYAVEKLIKAVDSYTQIYRKGCTPPDSVTWDGYGNNAQFLAQTIVMTPNQTLSIPNALKAARPVDYHDNAVSGIERWSRSYEGSLVPAAADPTFQLGRHTPTPTLPHRGGGG